MNGFLLLIAEDAKPHQVMDVYADWLLDRGYEREAFYWHTSTECERKSQQLAAATEALDRKQHTYGSGSILVESVTVAFLEEHVDKLERYVRCLAWPYHRDCAGRRLWRTGDPTVELQGGCDADKR